MTDTTPKSIQPSSGVDATASPAASLTESRTPSRLEFIDALRGFACVWVLLCHVQGYWIDRLPVAAHGVSKWINAAAEGFCKIGVAGVDLFIVLSGFCLYWPVIRSWHRGDAFLPKVFFIRRARRILPAYYVAVLLCTAIALYPPLQQHFVPRAPRLIDVASYLGLVMTFVPYHLLTVNGTYWSIALEAQLYICFPLLILLARHFGIKGVIMLSIVVTGSWQILQWIGLKHHLPINAGAYIYHIPARCFEFTAGMIAAQLVSSPSAGQGRAGLFTALLALPVALFCAKYEITTCSEILYSAWGITFAGLILYLAATPLEWFISLTRFGLFTRIGIVSYSLYLIHAPIMLLATDRVLSVFSQLHAGPLSIITAFLLLGVPILTILAYGFYLLFEKPFTNPVRRVDPMFIASSRRPGVVGGT